MGGLLHLVQRGGDWRAAAPPSSLLAVPDVTASPPIIGQYTNFILFHVALELPLHSKRLSCCCITIPNVWPVDILPDVRTNPVKFEYGYKPAQQFPHIPRRPNAALQVI